MDDDEAALAERIAKLRAAATKRQTDADAMRARVVDDYAYWTQPAQCNAAGQRFARQREKQREILRQSLEIAAQARQLRDKADRMEACGVVRAGDALARHQAAIAACDVTAGQMVDTTHFGIRRVLKVNRVSVLVDGGHGPLKVGKEYVRAVA